ncbi:MAG: hypothetical protein J6B65_02420 [Paludibacteraceae bacterium]|nr:hypothetical protein [Paludibacteraceae bacterium]
MLLKLSSKVKLRNFDIGMKMIALALHRWCVRPLLALYISYGVGAIALSIPMVMRRPDFRIKQ